MAFVTGRVEHPAKRVLKWLLIVALILAAAGAYLYLHPKLWRDWVKGTPLEPAPVVTRVYKWQDASGAWQVTGRPPPAGTKYEVMSYSSDANVVPSLPLEDEAK